jgi:hypothetical protein
MAFNLGQNKIAGVPDLHNSRRGGSFNPTASFSTRRHDRGETNTAPQFIRGEP